MLKKQLTIALLASTLGACGDSSEEPGNENTGSNNGGNTTLANNAPVLTDSSFTTNYTSPITILISELATDSDSDALSLSDIVSTNDVSIQATDTGFMVTPTAAFVGVDTISFKVSDGTDSVNGSVELTITNDVPVANDVSVSTESNSNVTITIDAQDNESSVTLDSFGPPENGSVAEVGGNWLYTPNSNFVGSDTFTYTVLDEVGDKATANIVVEVMNQLPTAADITFEVMETNSVNLDLSTVVSDPEASDLTFEFTAPSNGEVSENEGSFTYTPSAGFHGEDSFEYTVYDAHNGHASALVSITILEYIEPFSDNLILNDTGVVNCYDVTFQQTIESCDDTHIGQDATKGRDGQAAAGTLTKIGKGVAGFDFTKLDTNGNDLADDATEFACVRDNHTGIIWENKQDDVTSIHHYEWEYSYTIPADAPELVKEHFGVGAEEDCLNGISCTTGEYIATINQKSLCGLSNWRLPTEQEVYSIIDYSQIYTQVDPLYFPNIDNGTIIWTGDIGYKQSTSFKVSTIIAVFREKDVFGHSQPKLGHLGWNILLVSKDVEEK